VQVPASVAPPVRFTVYPTLTMPSESVPRKLTVWYPVIAPIRFISCLIISYKPNIASSLIEQFLTLAFRL